MLGYWLISAVICATFGIRKDVCIRRVWAQVQLLSLRVTMTMDEVETKGVGIPSAALERSELPCKRLRNAGHDLQRLIGRRRADVTSFSLQGCFDM